MSVLVSLLFWAGAHMDETRRNVLKKNWETMGRRIAVQTDDGMRRRLVAGLPQNYTLCIRVLAGLGCLDVWLPAKALARTCGALSAGTL